MVQIVKKKKKKKGTPPKLLLHGDQDLDLDLDLDRRARLGRRRIPDLRQTTRRRSVTYVDDELSESEEEEEEEEEEDEIRRREKKLLNTKPSSKRVDSVTNGGRRGGPVSEPEWSSSSEYDEPAKKRKIEVGTVRSGDQKKNSNPNGVSKSFDTIQTQMEFQKASKSVPLPDKQRLELLLVKLQKKDTYGVYAEPVDPEELPDYHDVIEHPMDFGTIKKKLASGAYSNLEQFEKDVYLICTNAMHYNAPETVYFKQARSIQELARKKFERLRNEFENVVAELKSEETIMPTHIVKKPIKTSSCKTIQEPVGSDFSSGATLATMGDIRTMPNVTQAGGCEKPSTVDEQVDGNSSLTENKPEKIEEQLSGKGFTPKLGRKPSVLDENRRATYNMSNQQSFQDDSFCTIFEGENVQLIPVGPNASHSYARSLARFTATLGPVAWGVASRRIEQALLPGIKFGRGWVGEYESLPTPVLMFETYAEKEQSIDLPAKSLKDEKPVAGMRVGAREPILNHAEKQPSSDLLAKSTKEERTPAGLKVGAHNHIASPVRMNENQMQWQPVRYSRETTESRHEKVAEGLKISNKNDVQVCLGAKSSSGLVDSCKSLDPAKERHFTSPTLEGNLAFFGSKSLVDATCKRQNISSMNNVRSDNVVLKQLNSVSACGNPIPPQKQPDHNSERTSLKLMEVVSKNRNLVQSPPFEQSETDGVAAGCLPNGKPGSTDNHQASSLTYAVGSNQQARAATYFSNGNHEQSISDPVQIMRMLAEKTQNQQKSINFAAINGRKIASSDTSLRRDDSDAASTAAARAWMTLGAGHFKPSDSAGSPKLQIAASSLYNSSREVPQSVSQNRENPPVSRVQFHCENKLLPQAFLPQPTHAGDKSRFLNNRQMGFPQFVTTDLSKFQVRSPWQGLAPHTQSSKDTLPPDLNISFQSPGSPVKQSSGAVVDSQQPDLALQL